MYLKCTPSRHYISYPYCKQIILEDNSLLFYSIFELERLNCIQLKLGKTMVIYIIIRTDMM